MKMRRLANYKSSPYILMCPLFKILHHNILTCSQYTACLNVHLSNLQKKCNMNIGLSHIQHRRMLELHNQM
jgi:hypothetical protein